MNMLHTEVLCNVMPGTGLSTGLWFIHCLSSSLPIGPSQGVIFPTGAQVIPAGNMKNLTGNLIHNPR